MKEPDVSGWSREELETAYKQMAKNCAARGQSLSCAPAEWHAEVHLTVEEWEQLRGELEKVDITKTPRFTVTDANGNTAEYVRQKLLYPCDPHKNKDCWKTGCYINGGECWQTSEKAYRRDDR